MLSFILGLEIKLAAWEGDREMVCHTEQSLAERNGHHANFQQNCE